jgi:hypothetical protein
VTPGLQGLVDGQRRPEGYEERVGRAERSGEPVRKEAGQGRTVYLPSLQFDGPMPEMRDYFSIENRFWKRPKNWQELVNAIEWAAKGNLAVRVNGPESLVANLVTQPDRRRVLLHLVNYNARKAPMTEAVQVVCHVPAPVADLRLFSPDFEQPQVLKWKNEASTVAFSVPPVKVYSIVAVNW